MPASLQRPRPASSFTRRFARCVVANMARDRPSRRLRSVYPKRDARVFRFDRRGKARRTQRLEKAPNTRMKRVKVNESRAGGRAFPEPCHGLSSESRAVQRRAGHCRSRRDKPRPGVPHRPAPRQPSRPPKPRERRAAPPQRRRPPKPGSAVDRKPSVASVLARRARASNGPFACNLKLLSPT